MVAALGLGAGACASGGASTAAFTGAVHDGPALALAEAVIVDSGQAHMPSLAWDPATKRLYAAWVRDSATAGPYGGQLGIPYVASSTDGGRSWSTPVRVTADETADAQSPQVLTVTKAGTLVDVWASYRADPRIPTGGEYRMELARSTDHGASFTLSSPSDGGIQQVSRPNVTTTPDGRVWLAWLDGRPVDQAGDYLFNVALQDSRDDARSFTPSWVVKGNACQCCRPALAQPPGDPNTLALIWRDVMFKPGTENHPMQMDGMDPNGQDHPGMVYARTDDRTIKVAVSHDGGHDFGAASSVHDFDWYLQACPTIGPSIFYDAGGKRMGVAWFNGSQQHTGVYYAESSDGGATFNTPVRLTEDIVGEGYDLVASFGSGGDAWVGWAAAGAHLRLAKITPSGEVRKTPPISGERIGMTITDAGPVLSYADPDHGMLLTRHVNLRATRVVVVLLAAVLSGCDAGALPSSGQAPSATTTAMAPDYSARLLGGTTTVSLQDLRGKPVLLTSWATWCVECRTELPAIQRLAQTYRDRGLQVLGVNVDEGGDAGPIAFAAQRGLSFPMVHDAHTRYQAAFRAVGVPQTELISADGRLLKIWRGVFDPAGPEAVHLIDASLPGVAGTR